jgi:tRNA-specific 2-thiouridylase
LEKGQALGFDAVCTGHYASIFEDEAGNLELHRSLEMAKDQSYVLGVLTAEQLSHSLFPLGATASKSLVREEADRRGLSVANKPDSYDICFIPEGDTRDWLKDFTSAEPGVIIDQDGNQVGTHDGHVGFTIGQRKGLNLGRPAKDGKPRYVLEIRPKTKEVVVGPEAALQIAQLGGSRFSWCGKAPEKPEIDFDCQVQVRAHGDAIDATAQVVDGELVINLKEQLYGVAPGQTAVLYVGTRVLGQTTIDRTVSAAVANV